MFKEYIKYIKDNPEGYWFKRKLYGWGWTPARWQGWSLVALYVVGIVNIFRKVDEGSHSASDALLNFALPFAILTGLLVILCRLKGEKPKWMWGLPKKNGEA